MSDYLPAGVTDAHPHFNPNEHYLTVPCTAEEALVVPSFAIKAQLNDLSDFIQRRLFTAGDMPYLKGTLESITSRIKELQGQIDEMEQEGTYECSWQGELELPESEAAEWDCPQCGSANTSDTLPEDRDPDEGWDNRDDD